MRVLITGGAKGIGRSVSLKLAHEGHSLIVVGRDLGALERLKQEIDESTQTRKTPATVDLLNLNLSEQDSGNRVFQAIEAKGWQKPDALVSNAGDYGVLGAIRSVDIQAWKKSFDLNFFSSVELTQEFLRIWEKEAETQSALGTKKGIKKIVLMSGSGLGGSHVWPGISAYACAKAALYRFMEVVHEEVHEMGFDINCVAPGAVKTGITDQAEKAGAAVLGNLFDATLKVKSQGGDSPDLAADLIARLLSSECDGLSGRLLSAKWDRKLLSQSKDIAMDKDLLRLRRIDNELFKSART